MPKIHPLLGILNWYGTLQTVQVRSAKSGVETVEELCEAFGSARSVKDEDESEQEMVLSFAETYEVLQKVKAFF
jgi:hypothetical protein